MFEAFERLPDVYQGIIALISGTLLLFYALGIITKGITIIVIACAIFLLLFGLVKSGLAKKIIALVNRVQKK